MQHFFGRCCRQAFAACLALALLFFMPHGASAAGGSLHVAITSDSPSLSESGWVTLNIQVKNVSAASEVSLINIWHDGQTIATLPSLAADTQTTLYAPFFIADESLDQPLAVAYVWSENGQTHNSESEFVVFRNDPATNLVLTRTIPTVVTATDAVIPIYTLENQGTTTLRNLVLTDKALGVSLTLETMAPGDRREIPGDAIVFTANAVSRPTVRYNVDGSTASRLLVKEPLNISLSHATLLLSVASDPPAINLGESALLRVAVTNNDEAPIKDLRIVCEELGGKQYEVPLLASGMAGFTKMLAPLSSTRYHFIVTGRDASGKEIAPLTAELSLSVAGSRQRKVNLSIKPTLPVSQLTGPGDIQLSVQVRNNTEETLYDLVITDPLYGEIGAITALPPHVEKVFTKTIRVEQSVDITLSTSVHFKDEPNVLIPSEPLRIAVVSQSGVKTPGTSTASIGIFGASPSPASSPLPSVLTLGSTPALPIEPDLVPGDTARNLLLPDDDLSEGALSWLRPTLIVLSGLAAMCAVVFIVLLIRRWRS